LPFVSDSNVAVATLHLPISAGMAVKIDYILLSSRPQLVTDAIEKEVNHRFFAVNY